MKCTDISSEFQSLRAKHCPSMPHKSQCPLGSALFVGTRFVGMSKEQKGCEHCKIHLKLDSKLDGSLCNKCNMV